MFSKSFAVFLFISLFLHLFGWSSIASGFQTGAPNTGLPNNSDGFAASTPVMTFVDPSNGQPYGRYIIDETIPVVAYSYQEVKERVYVPKTLTENKTTTITQYVPIQSHQLQLRNVPNWNPFASPQQVWQYVPIVQYQPNYVQVTQPVTYQKFEEQEVTRMVPVFGSQSKQVRRFVDRPLGQSPNGGNTIASNTTVNNPNFYQQAAQISQANRNSSRFPTRSIDYPYNAGYQSVSNRNWIAQAPSPYYPTPNYNPGAYYAPNPAVAGLNGAAQVMPNAVQNVAALPMSGNNLASNNNASNTLVIPAVPLRPNMQPNPNAIASYNGYGVNGNPNYGVAPNPTYPYANTASQLLSPWKSLASGTGSLFSSSLFSNNRNTSYVASNTPVAQPYVWGNNNQSGMSFRPNTSPYVTPQQSWGMPSGTSYRDPMQGGMPATVLR